MSDDTDDTAPDEEVQESTLLASVYLDGEATSDERALVETSPETLEEVESFSQVSGVLAATAPTASLSEREGHLAAALDVWERMSDLERSGEATPAAGVDAAAAAAVITPVSTSEGRRARGGRSKPKRSGSFGASQWFLGAAAALVVVAGAAAVVRGIIDAEPDNNDVAVEQAADDSAELSEVEANEAAEVAGENVGTDLAVDDPASIADEAQSNPEADVDGGLFEEDAMTEADESAEEASDETGPAEQPAPAPEVGLLELDTPDLLADYGSLVIAASRPGGPVITSDIDFEAPGESCEAELDIEEILEPILYQGEQVFVGVDLDNDIVFAYLDDCTVVESVPLPNTPTTEP